MIYYFFNGYYQEGLIAVFSVIMALTFHEFGHAFVAKKFGDNTAELQGRLTLNPVAHIDPMGFILVMIIGFGYAKPVPTNPRNYNHPKADLWISAAGPLMNLLIAVVAINVYLLMAGWGVEFFLTQSASSFFVILTKINLIIMVFNLIPLGALDGHYILPHFLSRTMAYKYNQWNDQYGNFILMGLVMLSLFGVPVFSFVWQLGGFLMNLVSFF